MTGSPRPGADEAPRSSAGALLRSVHNRGSTSRAELTVELGLNRSTIRDLTGQLEAVGLVREELPGTAEAADDRVVVARRPGPGRPSMLVRTRTDVVVLAYALDVDRITAAVVALGGQVLARRTRLHQRGSHEPSAVIASMAQLCETLLAETDPRHCVGVGVSVPGAVRAIDGVVRFAPNLGWVDEPFGTALAAALGQPVQLANEADLGMLAEHVRGAAAGLTEAAYISGSVGIGGGFLVGGRLLSGTDGYAGEVGHLPIDPAGEQCRCGAIGCWETKVGENHLLTRAGRLPGGGPEAVAEVVSAADAGDAAAAEALDAVARWTGRGLRAVVNLFNPEVMVLGGVLRHVYATRRDLVLAGLEHATLIGDRSLIELARLGDDSSLVGAAELAFEPLLADPLRWDVGDRTG